MQYIVAGAGPAGVVACETIRKLSPDASITLIGAEPEPPYSRMAIPYLLSEIIAEQGTYLRKTDGYYEQMNINRLQQRISGIDASASQLKLDNSESLDFDRLLLATGAIPINPHTGRGSGGRATLLDSGGCQGNCCKSKKRFIGSTDGCRFYRLYYSGITG